MSLNSDAISWIRPNQSLLLFVNISYIVQKQQILMFILDVFIIEIYIMLIIVKNYLMRFSSTRLSRRPWPIFAIVFRPIDFLTTNFFFFIIWLPSLLTMSILDKGYFRNVALNYISTFLLIVFDLMRPDLLEPTIYCTNNERVDAYTTDALDFWTILIWQ